MKQHFFTFLKMGLASVFLTILTFNSTKAQITIFSENVGAASVTTKLPAYTGWQNQGVLMFDSGQVAASADVRSTSISSTYTGASGGSNVFFSGFSGSYGLSIEGINAATYSNMELSFGYRKESGTILPTFSVDYWNGTSWVTVANTAAALFNQTATSATGWYLAKTLSLPAGAQINGLKIRFVKSGTQSIRLDDIKLTGTGTSSSSISVSSATLASALTSTYGTASSDQTVTVTGSGLTANVVATSSNANIEVSSNGTSYGSTATFVPTSNTVNGTLYVRLASSATIGSYNNASITLTSANATNKTVSTTASGNNVSAKELTITGITIADKVVDGNVNATILGTPSLQGVIAGDTVFLSGYPFAQFTSASVGSNIPVNVSGFTISGNGTVNYLLTQPLVLSANIFNNSSQLNNDVGISSILKPIESGCGASIDSVIVILNNFGIASQTNIPISYSFNGNIPVLDTMLGILAPQNSIRYAFPIQVTSTAGSNNSLVVFSQLLNDGYRSNDSARIFFSRQIPISGANNQNFDSVPSFWSNGGFNSSWDEGVPSASIQNSPISYPNVLATNLSGDYNNNEDSWIQTSCYDISSLVKPMVKFDLNFITENNYDGLFLEATTDGGATWTTVGGQGTGSNWYNGLLSRTYRTGPVWMGNSNGWTVAEHSLDSFNKSTNLIFRFRFVTDGSVVMNGINIDNFEIYDSNSFFAEISVNQINFKKPNSCGLIADTMMISIKNNSNSVISNLPIQIKINGVSDSLVLSNTILPLDSFNFNYPLSSKLVSGRNDILVYSSLSGDIDKTNDTLSITRMISNNDSFSLNLPDTVKSTNTSVTLNPGSANSFLWSTGETTPTITVNNLGKYSVLAFNSAGCSSTDTTLVLFFRTAPKSTSSILGSINYQATLANPTGNPMSNQTIKIRFSIQDSLNTNYSEWQSVQTDSRGHIAVQVGNGNKIYGSLGGITWWDGLNRTLKTEIDTSGTGNWIVLGNSQLVSVPSALYALKSGDGSSSIYGSIDPNGNILTGNGFSVTPHGNGNFDIDFQQPFTEVPIFWVKSVGSGNYSEKIISVSPSKISFQVTGSPNRIQFEAKGK